MSKKFIYDLSIQELMENLSSQDNAQLLLKHINKYFYLKKNSDVMSWDKVSKANKEFLLQNFNFDLPKIVWNGLSLDGTRKFLVGFEDGNTVEAVAIPAKDRLTLCISSQVGCAIGCTFCHTGTQGLKRSLSTAEIVGQFLAVSRWLLDNTLEKLRLTNIVYMGQGEPLHNFENVKKSISLFLNSDGIALSKNKITLSTSGLAHQIENWEDFPEINIAISLHAVRNDLRSKLMPINKAHDLERLFKALKTIPVKASRRITYEYLLIKDLNDQEEDILGLCELLNRKESKINIIPFNEYPGSDYKRPTNEKVAWFQNRMHENGYTCTVRVTKGDDILAACGQLKTEFEKLNIWDGERISPATYKSKF